ncbi:hypothetical protein EOI86_02110 [Hwanghaeella grinnelliae]|uniref:Uncharacterized protein n=1 Tax=Hwanghaeella grinnelliae TaxID=2500179 RepID=A0A3S2VQS3_9PROT|nr:hypothetical protein [Hwanghaeella grinnelliae]RVU38121.1 hypothetical protein EOI86_02110 [Hwanghaeella grinnelliae]
MSDTARPCLALWRIVAPNHVDRLPSGFLTATPGLPDDRVPMEVGLLLPAGRGRGVVTDTVIADPAAAAGRGVGLFMANPFLAVDREAARLQAAGIGWVSNLPSTHQQDADFQQQLQDVGLDWARELACLAKFGDLGLKRLAVLCDEAACEDVLAAKPNAVAILPRVADFAAGFPSMLRRGGSAQAVANTLLDAGWQGPVLVLGSEAEAASPALWPPGVDGLLLRPVIWRAVV